MPIPTAPVLDSFLSPVPETEFAPTPAARMRWPVSILGVPLDPVTTDEALARIADMVASGRPHYVVTPNVDFLVQARHDEDLRRILCEADLALCDGQPLVWASRWLGNPLPERVAGADLTPRLLEQAARLGHRVFLLGATPESNDEARARLQQRLPGLQLAGQYAPPFRPLAEMDHEDIICRVRAAKPDIVLVSFGCPKQEKWIAMHYRELGVPVCLGVGATIDFLAGRISRAPVWMRRSGLEWTYRLGMEPRRLFRRYATDARYFGTALVGQLLANPRQGTAAGILEFISAQPPLHHLRASGALCRPVLDAANEVAHRIMGAGCDCQVDLADVNFIDSTGIGAITAWHRQLRRTGHRLVLGRPSEAVRRMLRQLRLTHFETSENAPAGAAA